MWEEPVGSWPRDHFDGPFEIGAKCQLASLVSVSLSLSILQVTFWWSVNVNVVAATTFYSCLWHSHITWYQNKTKSLLLGSPSFGQK